MPEEPVDRRGLFRDLFRQASEAVAPVLAARLDAVGLELPEPAPRIGRPVTIDELLRAAADHGLSESAEEIGRLARRTLRVMPAAHAREAPARFGGRPLLEEGTEWPTWQGRELTFLAQVETGGPLGLLAFYYDTVGRPTGCLAAHRGSARVIGAGDSRLVPAEGPALPLQELPGVLAEELVLPRVFSDLVEALELPQASRDSWEALREELADLQGGELADRGGSVFRVVHRVFGYPDNAGAEMPLTCELASSGEDVIEGRAHLHPRAPELIGRASRWELLAQLSGDGKLGWPWVAQRVYFWIDRDALAAGELGEVWALAR